MVNTGKPSRGCYMCRARRIKCDEGKPSCLRCQKSKRVCPGYRDAFELKLRDESKSTKKKLSRRSSQVLDHNTKTFSQDLFCESRMELDDFSPYIAPAAMAHRRCRSESSLQSNDFWYDFMVDRTALQVHPHHHLLSSHMTTPIHQQAACYFLANFVLIPQEGTMRGYLDFIIPLLEQGGQSRPLSRAFSAAALASLGTRPNSKSLIPQADLFYVEALKEINVALKDPIEASSDSTLAAVMLLASFEQLVPSRMKVGGWASHIDGAVAMIKSRPKSTWQTSYFQNLFLAVRAHMTIQCIANARAADAAIDWLSISSNDPIADKFVELNLKMAELRADNDQITPLADHTTENLEKVLKLLRRAESLEKEYAKWTATLPPSWAIRTVAWIEGDVGNLDASVIHPGKVVSFGELWMAYYYNVVRACRICIWTVVLRCVAWMSNPRDYRLSPEYSTASSACRQLIEDTVSSVPFFFGWNREIDPSMADKSNFGCGINNDSSVKGLAGIFSMWPMFIAASSDFASPSQRIYLRGRLRYIAEQMGVNQAVILLQAQLLHPSLYIARERVNLTPTTCGTDDTDVTFIDGELQSAVINVPRPTLDSGWIPRSFHQQPDDNMSVTEEIMQDVTGPMGVHNDYDHELAMYGVI